MSARPDDLEVRKQLLLARIALQRAELRSEMAQVGEAARLPNLLRSVDVGHIGRSLLGASGAAAPAGGWIALALTLLRRYRLATALFGAAAPLLRRRGARPVFRLARLGALATVAWLGWRVLRRRLGGT